MSISPAFNVVDLFLDQGTFEPLVFSFSVSTSTSSTLVPRTPSTTLEPPNESLDALDDGFVTSHFGGYRRSLVGWKDHSLTDDNWIIEKEFCRLDPALLEDYLRFTSSGMSSFQPGE